MALTFWPESDHTVRVLVERVHTDAPSERVVAAREPREHRPHTALYLEQVTWHLCRTGARWHVTAATLSGVPLTGDNTWLDVRHERTAMGRWPGWAPWWLVEQAPEVEARANTARAA